MGKVPFDCRYSVITEKNPREIVLLRGTGCRWRRCRFCDYHLDFDLDETENYQLNHRVLQQVTGKFQRLEVINSGSFVELSHTTMNEIRFICKQRGIKEVYFECHWMYRNEVPKLRDYFQKDDIVVKVKIGVETFDSRFRESYLDKGIDTDSPQEIAAYFDQVCLLFGLPGQTVASMKRDIAIALSQFERVCVNIMVKNTKPIQPDPSVIELFRLHIYPHYQENPRIDILWNNTDFGVGV